MTMQRARAIAAVLIVLAAFHCAGTFSARAGGGREGGDCVYEGEWYGDECYYGLHYDFHAQKRDTDIGAHATAGELVPLLRLMAPDYIQTDCKGHAGYTSWFSRAPAACVSPGVVRDALAGWREAARRLGVPLHCHYSGIWDAAAGEKHPEWRRVNADGTRDPSKMCVRGGYLEGLLIPQLRELIDRYEVDGFWVDGDIWAAAPCWCERCKAAFTEKTGIPEAPLSPQDPDWNAWILFTLESYNEYVTRYCDFVHEYKPGVKVCANWIQTIHNPGRPAVPTDWISGDNPHSHGQDRARCEARFISTRGKPWDIMLWNFYKSGDGPWIVKPLDMLKQEAAFILPFGGSLQVYENPGALRDGRLAGWRMKRLGELGRWVKKRRELCRNTQTIPQVAVLLSEAHVRANLTSDIFGSADIEAARSALYAALENNYGADLMDEWALTPRLSQFPIVIAPEQDDMSDEMVAALKTYVRAGGALLLTGAAAYERFGGDFLGVEGDVVEDDKAYHVPGLDGAVAAPSPRWRLVETRGARAVKPLLENRLLSSRKGRYVSAALNDVGDGRVAYAPFALFAAYGVERSRLLRAFIGDILAELAGDLEIRVEAPSFIDAVFRRRGATRIIHLVNRATGAPVQWDNSAVDEIPRAGPVKITMRTAEEPESVFEAFEGGAPEWHWRDGRLSIGLRSVHIHSAIVVKE